MEPFAELVRRDPGIDSVVIPGAAADIEMAYKQKKHRAMGNEEWMSRLRTFAALGVWPSEAGNRPAPRQKKWYDLKIEKCPMQLRGKTSLFGGTQTCNCGFHTKKPSGSVPVSSSVTPQPGPSSSSASPAATPGQTPSKPTLTLASFTKPRFGPLAHQLSPPAQPPPFLSPPPSQPPSLLLQLLLPLEYTPSPQQHHSNNCCHHQLSLRPSSPHHPPSHCYNCSSTPSMTPAAPEQQLAVDERSVPGMDRVDSLAEYLVGLRTETGQTLNNQQASTIIALWQNLLPYDQQRVAYAARHQTIVPQLERSMRMIRLFVSSMASLRRVRALTDLYAADDWQLGRASNVFFLGDFINIEASVVQANHVPLRVFVDTCVATLDPDMNAVPSYAFIENKGCLMDSKLTNSHSQFLSRVQDDKLQFQLDAFRFAQEARSAVHGIVQPFCVLGASEAVVMAGVMASVGLVCIIVLGTVFLWRLYNPSVL
ncbi:hypothetical protein SKAU_G00012310 [Synaphobranchus kaupii]|uniref:Zona pellucida sperm-binding protein 3 n=1 Tax=Synaphobranchus kaupii TaxID=118154 RepID=A0A9Q1GB82_SYNKA|nr:hypothetical protein SKAU_G00012310 [Synaphobranchus kaupii]